MNADGDRGVRVRACEAAGPAPEANPYVGRIGWCHSCESLQWGDDARWREMWWMTGEWDWVCVNCDGEPWGLGVWIRSTRPVDRESSLGQKVTSGANIYDLDVGELSQLERPKPAQLEEPEEGWDEWMKDCGP